MSTRIDGNLSTAEILKQLARGDQMQFGPIDLLLCESEKTYVRGQTLDKAGLYAVLPEGSSAELNPTAPYVHLAPLEGAQSILENLMDPERLMRQRHRVPKELDGEQAMMYLKDHAEVAIGPIGLIYYENADLPAELRNIKDPANPDAPGHDYYMHGSGDLSKEGLWMEMPGASYGTTMRINPHQFLASPADAPKIVAALVEHQNNRSADRSH